MSIRNCKECGNPISSKAKVCPHCGIKIKKTPIGCLIVLLFLLWLFISFLTHKHSTPQQSISAIPANTAEQKQKTESVASNYRDINVPSLYGKTPDELNSVFGKLTAASGESVKLENFSGWKKVFLSFNQKSRLASIGFIPENPLSENQARHIAENSLKLKLPKTYEAKPLAGVFYRDMPGKIRTINMKYQDWKAETKAVGEISVHYNIEWEE